jgi:hypothetical protein
MRVVRRRDTGKICAVDFMAGGFRLSFHCRTHHPEIPLGVWRMCINGIQAFAGPFAITINWPVSFHGLRVSSHG